VFKQRFFLERSQRFEYSEQLWFCTLLPSRCDRSIRREISSAASANRGMPIQVFRCCRVATAERENIHVKYNICDWQIYRCRKL